MFHAQPRSHRPGARLHSRPCTCHGRARRVAQAARSTEKIPITTSSDEARALYLKARDLAERLRATDARRLYEQAAAKDNDFALTHVGLANTSGTTKEFIEATTRAAALAPQVSPGERHVVLALEAAMRATPRAC